MPNWKKIIVSGSDAVLRSLTVSNGITISGSLNLSGSFLTTNIISASKVYISSSGTNQLTIIGSGSTNPILLISGSQGGLLTVSDSLSGSLFSVNDAAGYAIFDVNSDKNVYIGDYQALGLHTSKLFNNSSNPFKVYETPTTNYDGMFVEYIAKSGSNARAGNIMAIRSGSTLNYTETTTTDIGNTSELTLLAAVSQSYIVLSGSATTTNWTIKAIIRAI